ncbi:outer membrane protein [Poseidonocella sedimentorum]|uniref:Opacity protein n=1 Tax=Poseidonocella sedimentorum TaxID=871652 RepID=A0A1I6EHZ7_9RHOB|nr:outer membrane beta-barrel protein [Poseidonocella sedimentorum]SFR17277.1 Opacity protein [Poseidonocella sedimentorum]
MKTLIATLAMSTALMTPALAGGLDDPEVEAPVAAPVVPVAVGTDWTGFYAGGQVGMLNGEVDAVDADGDGTIYGLHAGYNYDFGSYVLGGEFDYDWGDDIDLDGAATIDSVARLKLKAGYDAGPALIYATAGAAQLGVDELDDNQTGSFYGAGVSYLATDNIMIGGEVLKHDFNDLDDVDEDADATTFSLRASYKF